MSTNKDNLLFSEFDPISRSEWVEKATDDLRGADFDRRLVWKNLNGIDVQPFYTRAERKSTLEGSGTNTESFTNYRRIPVETEDKNTFALKAIAEGMNGVLFEVGNTDEADRLLTGIDLKACSVAFELDNANVEFLKGLQSYFSNSETADDQIQGFIDLKLFDRYLQEGVLSDKDLDFLAETTALLKGYDKFRTLAVSGKSYIDSGSNQIQEIAFTLNSLVFLTEQLKERDLELDLIFDNLHFTFSTGSEYFVEIAKLRAFSSLFLRVAQTYGLTDVKAYLMSKTSVWSKSVTDANTNMLRATTEAMSALLGNAQAVEIDPYDLELGTSSDFSRRIAGNIATILKEESYFGKVSNPVDGSYYIEELTHQLAERSLDLFKEIESLGGFYKSVEQQVIQNKISLIRLTRIKLLSQRRTAMVGVNKYPNLMEEVKEESLSHETVEKDPKTLRSRRAGLELERIRANTEQFTEQRGKRPLVEFAGFGNLAMRKARSGFAFDFLGVAGYAMADEKSYESAVKAAEDCARSESDIVVICSSDDDYKSSALDFVRSFRSIDESKILLLAGNPVELIDQLTEAGLDACIHVRSDIVGTLDEINNKLSRKTKTLEI